MAKASESTLCAHLQTLQARITAHGSRMWQLPLTYLATIAGSAALLNEGLVETQIASVFGVLSVLGAVFIWCFLGAWGSYQRTANDMNRTERLLGLQECTQATASHMLPYLTIMLLGIAASISLFVNPHPLVTEQAIAVEVVEELKQGETDE